MSNLNFWFKPIIYILKNQFCKILRLSKLFIKAKRLKIRFLGLYMYLKKLDFVVAFQLGPI